MGIHLRAAQLYQSDHHWLRQRRSGQLLAASCHNEQELLLAEALGIDFVTLSPVKSTQTHPDATPLGTTTAKQLTEHSNLPTYWLGGMTDKDMALAIKSGAQGVAVIGCYWY